MQERNDDCSDAERDLDGLLERMRSRDKRAMGWCAREAGDALSGAGYGLVLHFDAYNVPKIVRTRDDLEHFDVADDTLAPVRGECYSFYRGSEGFVLLRLAVAGAADREDAVQMLHSVGAVHVNLDVHYVTTHSHLVDEAYNLREKGEVLDFGVPQDSVLHLMLIMQTYCAAVDDETGNGIGSPAENLVRALKGAGK